MAARGSVLVLDGFWPKTLVAVRALAAAGERVVAGEQTRLAPALWSNASDGMTPRQCARLEGELP